MPVYSFICKNCNEDLTKMCPINDRDNQSCPKCGLDLTRKIDKPGAVWSPTRNGGMTV